jgi:hypothetical protein
MITNVSTIVRNAAVMADAMLELAVLQFAMLQFIANHDTAALRATVLPSLQSSAAYMRTSSQPSLVHYIYISVCVCVCASLFG